MGLINKKQEYQDQEAWSDNVQKLKGYKEFVEKVEYWAEQNNKYNNPIIRGSYETVFDKELGWCVDVDDYVSFSGSNIEEIPIQFRKVGWFFCNYCNKLTSLKGCPKEVVNIFKCNECKNLKSLKYCPKEVSSFYCDDCGKKFKEEYVRSLCNVKGNIYI